MKRPTDITGNYEIARLLAEKGVVSIPCFPDTKVPCLKTWKPWQTMMPPDELLREWFEGTRNNIAIVCTNLVIFDCDDPAKAELVLDYCGDTPHKLKSPR